MAKFYDKLNLLVMPTDQCNMNCVYCFHKEHHKHSGKMSEDTLRKLYDIVCQQYKQINIIWHGGEPLLMGLDFYKKAISLQKAYTECKFDNQLQTNLTLMNQDFAEFFINEKVSIGSSFDGLSNDTLRGKTDQILDGRRLLMENGTSCGFIMVISKKNIDLLIENYQYFNDHHIEYSMNLYVEALDNKNSDLTLEPAPTIERLKHFFDVWIMDENCSIHIDYFERIIRYLLYRENNLCKYSSCLGKWVGIRYNGDIVPCNRYFPKEYGYGNVFDYEDIGEAFESDGFKKLLSEAIIRREKCKSCEAFEMCSGGCNNVALNENGVSENNGTSCEIFRELFLYIKQSIKALIRDREGLYEVKNPQVTKILRRTKISSDIIR